MRAAMVRHAAIVASGAHGAYAIKRPPSTGGPAALAEEAAACCRLFVAGVLDLTDNVVAGKVVAPARVVRHDEDDVYRPRSGHLRLRAGHSPRFRPSGATADAAACELWLLARDSFAAGGSRATTTGSWASSLAGRGNRSRRHFRGLKECPWRTRSPSSGSATCRRPFGNGMLLSPGSSWWGRSTTTMCSSIRDPDPDASLAERRRLFDRRPPPGQTTSGRRSPKAAVSVARSTGRIRLSPRSGERSISTRRRLSPDELIRALLCAPVDLLFNGGAGTFVKARTQTNTEVGDRPKTRCGSTRVNSAVASSGGQQRRLHPEGQDRIRAWRRTDQQLRNRQRAGVNCSDHEVNLKSSWMSRSPTVELTPRQRNELLPGLTDAVTSTSSAESYAQALALSLERRLATELLDLHARLIDELDSQRRPRPASCTSFRAGRRSRS